MREATNERSLRRTLLLAIACAQAAVHTLPCAAQPPLEFDVASIKPAPPGPGNTTMKFEPGGRFRATGAPLNALTEPSQLGTSDPGIRFVFNKSTTKVSTTF
jgi:hypothetical protein